MSTEGTVLIAVVDDEAGVRTAIKRLLCSAGLRVETFAGGDEILASLADHRPDCMVLDLHMPRVTGFDVLERLAQRHMALPVVIITAHDSPQARERALAAGASAYLRKPVDDLTLMEAITAAIGHPPAAAAR